MLSNDYFQRSNVPEGIRFRLKVAVSKIKYVCTIDAIAGTLGAHRHWTEQR